MTHKIAVLPGDGIGPEITEQAVRVLRALDLDLELHSAPVGGAAYEAQGHPLPASTLELAQSSAAVLFGAVGDWKYDSLPRELRPEQAILGLRKAMGLFANLRPAILYPQLANASSLKPEVVAGLDILIVRELTGDIYFGQPRGVREVQEGAFKGERQGFDTMHYAESEVRRIAHVAFQAAGKRGKRLCSVDKANVLETSQFWRDIMISVAAEYPQIELSHMYVDNAAMQLVRAPKAFDVIVTGNLFGDILSDEAAMLTGSDRHAAFRVAELRQPGAVRTQPRLGAGHRRQERGQPPGDHTVGRHALALFAEFAGTRGAHRSRRAKRAGTGPADRGYLRRRREQGFHQPNG